MRCDGHCLANMVNDTKGHAATRSYTFAVSWNIQGNSKFRAPKSGHTGGPSGTQLRGAPKKACHGCLGASKGM